MVELRKRPAPPAAPPPAKKKAPAKPKADKDKPASTVSKMEAAEISTGGTPTVGQSITLEGFGGDVQTNDEETVTLSKLVEDSKAGVVLFTYPKASTPGCKIDNPFVRQLRYEAELYHKALRKSACFVTRTSR